MRRQRNPLAIAAVMIVLASVNLSGVFGSARGEQIATVDALRLIAAGMLLGVALVLMFTAFRRQAT
jgi:hypothetical protein